MELLALPSFPYILASLLLLLFSILLLQKKATHSKSNLPPGPWTLPIIGCLHHLATAKLMHRAFHNLAQMYGPVMLLRTGEIDLVVITSREAAKESKDSPNHVMRKESRSCQAGVKRSFNPDPISYVKRIEL